MDAYIEKLEAKKLKPLLVLPSGRMPIDFADELKGAEYYIGSWLTAKKAGNVYSSPGGTFLRTFSPGQMIGQIYTYVLRNGVIWWELKTGGFVEHAPGKFDTAIANETASGKEHEENVKNLNELAADPLEGFGDGLLNGFSFITNNLKFLVIGLVLIVLVTTFLKLKTA